MAYRRIVLSAAICLIAVTLIGAEPECANNYRAEGKSAETFVITGLTPTVVIERLPRLLVAAGVSMRSTEPAKGILNAEGLEVRAEASENATRVTFRSSAGADEATLCRYATLVGNPPVPAVPQDPALIAKMKDDLIKKHSIVQQDVHGLNEARFTSPNDFLDLAIKSVKDPEPGKRVYGISLLLPRTACTISSEDIADASAGFGGNAARLHTKPARVEATLVYTKDGTDWQLADATITHIESTK